jgi:formamidopyrimidine-DNA glycosylase
MPELPEVETIRRTLAPVLLGALVSGALRGEHPEDILLDPWPVFARRVRRHRIVALERRGKYLAARFEDGDRLVIHLGMTGELRLSHPATAPGKHCHLALVLRSLRPLPPSLVDQRQRFLLRYLDIRRFGRIALLDQAGWETFTARLGPEPLDPTLDPRALWSRLRERRTAIKAALLDQALLAGIGNIYADEALYQARLHPARRCQTLSLDEVERLLVALRTVLSAAIENAGTTIRDYRDGQGRAGSFQSRLQVYGKPAGTPCPRCGTGLARIRIAGRSSVFCPRCQLLE